MSNQNRVAEARTRAFQRTAAGAGIPLGVGIGAATSVAWTARAGVDAGLGMGAGLGVFVALVLVAVMPRLWAARGVEIGTALAIGVATVAGGLLALTWAWSVDAAYVLAAVYGAAGSLVLAALLSWISLTLVRRQLPTA
jgi:hypothetical protein